MQPQFDMLGIVCADMAASIRFYNMLGWAFTAPEDGGPYTEVTLSSGLRISLNDVAMIKSMEPDWAPPTGHRMGVAFLCGSPAGVDMVHADMVAAGYVSHKDPWDAFWGQRYAQIADPDGNVVDLFAWIASPE